MGIINIVKNVKEIHKEYIVLVRVGNFYNCYGRDSYIVSYLFGYKINAFPKTINNIGTYAFYNCKGINKITIPDTISVLNNYVFYSCSKITEIKIPANITSIGTSALAACSGLSSIIVEEGNTVYDSRNNCNAIIQTASNKLIAGCKTTNIPSEVLTIESNAFLGCSGLTNINDLISNVTAIGSYAFANCTGITSINISKKTTNLNVNPFYGCTNLTSITVASGNTVYDSRNNCNAVVKKSNNAIIVACKNTAIDNTVKIIDQHSFRGQSGLTSITIPSNITTIGSSAFYQCTGLTSITIPNSVTSLGTSAFYGCSKITSITIPSTINSLGSSVFYGCSALTNITIPSSISTIGPSAFYNCTSLTTVEIPSSVTKIDTNAFANCSKLETAYIYGSSLQTLNKGAFNNLKTGSTIYVGNTTIKALFTSDRYTKSRTTISVDATLLN